MWHELQTLPKQQFFNKELLLQLKLQFACEEDDSNRSIEFSKKQNVTEKQISKAMCLINESMEFF